MQAKINQEIKATIGALKANYDAALAHEVGDQASVDLLIRILKHVTDISRHLAAQQAPLKERTMSRHQLDFRGTEHD